jgi:hypothetical protein
VRPHGPCPALCAVTAAVVVRRRYALFSMQ